MSKLINKMGLAQGFAPLIVFAASIFWFFADMQTKIQVLEVKVNNIKEQLNLVREDIEGLERCGGSFKIKYPRN